MVRMWVWQMQWYVWICGRLLVGGALEVLVVVDIF